MKADAKSGNPEWEKSVREMFLKLKGSPEIVETVISGLHLKVLPGVFSPETIIDRLIGYKKLILDKINCDQIDSLMLEYINFKIDAFKYVEHISLPNDTVTHGDYQTRNIMIDSVSREIIGICDWEKAEIAPRSYEVARAIFYICFESGSDVEQELLKLKEFLDGYQLIYPVGKDELMKGVKMRVNKMVSSAWIEDMYYNQHSGRANHFIKSEMRTIELALKSNLYFKMEALF